MLVGGDGLYVYINSNKDLKLEFLSDELWFLVWDNFLIFVGRLVFLF